MPTVVIPALLRKLTNGQERVAVRGASVRQVVEDLERQFPGIETHLLEDGDLIDPVKETSEIYFLPAIGGGLR
jgi:molybdopterin converting factor small subunit